MKARILLSVVLAAMLVVSIPVKAFAVGADDAQITIVMSGQGIAIDVSVLPATLQIQPVELNSSYCGGFTLTNNGSVGIDTTIVGTNATGDGYNWTLSTSPGNNVYAIEYNISEPGGQGNIITTPTDFVKGLRPDKSKNFKLTVKTPTSGNCPGLGESVQATVTIQAIQEQ